MTTIQLYNYQTKYVIHIQQTTLFQSMPSYFDYLCFRVSGGVAIFTLLIAIWQHSTPTDS